MAVRWVPWMLLALSTPALASPECAPFVEQDLRELVARSKAAIDADDVVSHGALFRELQARLPCLEAQVPKEAWAEFLVGMAVVEFALGRSWEPPLRTALGIHPSVTRDYGPPEIREYPLPEGGQSGTATLAAGAVYFVDGVVVTTAPSLDGLHVVQRLEGGSWTTEVLLDEPFPAEWIAAPPPPVVEPPPAQVVEPRPPGHPRSGRGLFATGIVMCTLGSLTGGGTYWIGHGGGIFTKGQADALEVINVAGWTLAGTGLVVGVVGLGASRASPGQPPVAVDAGPGGLQVRGRF